MEGINLFSKLTLYSVQSCMAPASLKMSLGLSV